MKLSLKASELFEKIRNAKKRNVVLEGGARCFGPDQSVITRRGSIAISEISIGDEVLTFNFDTGEKEFCVVERGLCFANVKPCLRVMLMNGQTITATEDHKLFFEGGWNSLKHIVSLFERRYAYGNVESDSRLQPVSGLRCREIAFDELQEEWKDASFETGLTTGRIFANNAAGRFWQVPQLEGSQVCDAGLCRTRPEGIGSESQGRNQDTQPIKQSGIRNSFTEYQARIRQWIGKAIAWCGQSVRKTHRETGQRDQRVSGIIQGEVLRPANVGEEVWYINSSRQRYCKSQTKQLAGCLTLDAIASVESVSLPIVYDISVHHNHNYFLDCGEPILVHNSSKTYSTLIYFITDAFASKKPREYDIVRQTLPALKASAMKDFFEILKSNGIYSEAAHNMSDHSYVLHGCTFNFYSADDTQKLRGRKRDKILLNEANELSLDTYRQVAMRTTEQIVMDYNPSEEESWIYDHVIPRDDCAFIQSTYKDNPFLDESIVEEIERLEVDDPEYWKIYGLGLRGKRTGLIYPNYKIIPEFPECSDVLYGLDFGYNDPKVVVRIGRIGKKIFIDELLYERGMVREEFVPKLKELVPEEQRTKEQYADSEDPETIEVIYRAGFNIHPADKAKGSVLFGIETVRSYDIYITARSVNVQKDFKNYKWKVDKNGKTLDEPIHAFSHSPDAVRYPVYTHWGKEYRNMTSSDARNTEIEESEAITVAENY